MPDVVLDASALVDLVAGTARARAVGSRLRGTELHSIALVDAEVLSALGRLVRGGHLAEASVPERLAVLERMPVVRHDLPPLLLGAWARRGGLRLTDALYVELADRLGIPLVTTDLRLARATSVAEAIT